MHCWWECTLVQPLWKTVGRFFKKLKIELLYDLAFPLLGIYLKKMKTLTRNTCTPMSIAALFTIAKIWKQPKHPSMDGDTHAHMRACQYYSAIKKRMKSFLFLTIWMSLEGIMLNEISRRKTDTIRSHLNVES